MNKVKRLFLILIIFSTIVFAVRLARQVMQNKRLDLAKLYKPYNFIEKDLAELEITKFLRFLERNDEPMMNSLIDKTSQKSAGKYKNFLKMRRQIQLSLIYLPRQFIFTDSLKGMKIMIIDKLSHYSDTRIIQVRKVKDDWLIDPESDFFNYYEKIRKININTKKI